MNAIQRFNLGIFLKKVDTDVPLSSAQGSKSVPYQRWMHFKEAFSPEFVSRTIEKSEIRVESVLDWYGGSGSTALTAQFHGIRPATCEVNPFLADLIEAKLCRYDLEEVSEYANTLHQRASRQKPDLEFRYRGGLTTLIEPGIKDRWIYPRDTAYRIAQYVELIETFPEKISRLFRVLLGACLIQMSNVYVQGKGRRYKVNWKCRQKTPADVDQVFSEKIKECLFDIKLLPDRACFEYDLYRGDNQQNLSKVDTTDLILFSPPYPNSFDYTDIYNVELWVLGYLKNFDENRALREATMRSHVSLNMYEAEIAVTKTVEDIYSNLDAVRSELWHRRIPEMVRSYFHDLSEVIERSQQTVRPGGHIVMVIGDSCYAGIHVDTAKVVAELASNLGLERIECEEMRVMRASAQQGGSVQLGEWGITLKRPA